MVDSSASPTAPNTLKTIEYNKEPVYVAPLARPVEKPHVHVMDFLKQLSKELKTHTPALPESLKEKVDAYIREHGNRHPDATVAK